MTEDLPSEYLLTSGSEQDASGYLVRIFDGEAMPLSPEVDKPNHLPSDVSLVLQQSVNELVKAVPNLQMALKSGRMFEVVGPREAVEGLKNGTLKLMESKGDLLGAIVPQGGGRIEAQARFRKLTVLATPAVVYQVLSIATSQYYLATITQQLDEILRGMGAVINRTRNEAWGKLLGAQQTVREVAEQLQAAPRATDGAAARLAPAEAHINAVTYEALSNIEEFARRAEQLISRRLGRKECADLLDDAESQLAQDVALYREAVQARLLWLRATLLLDSLTIPEASSLHIRHARTFIEEVSGTQAILAALGESNCLDCQAARA